MIMNSIALAAGATPRQTSVEMTVGRMYKEYPCFCGTQSLSTRISSFRHSTNSLPSKVGRSRRAVERFIRAAFMSGRKRRTSPSAVLYAFIPSKHCRA
eukprot:gene19565-biopygen19848